MLVQKWASCTLRSFEIIVIESFQLLNLVKEAADVYEFAFETLFNHKIVNSNVKRFSGMQVM